MILKEYTMVQKSNNHIVDHIWTNTLSSTVLPKATVRSFRRLWVLTPFSPVRLFATPWTVAHQASSVHGILQGKLLENPMSRGAQWATVLGVTESDMTEQLSMHSYVLHIARIIICWKSDIQLYHKVPDNKTYFQFLLTYSTSSIL